MYKKSNSIAKHKLNNQNEKCIETSPMDKSNSSWGRIKDKFMRRTPTQIDGRPLKNLRKDPSCGYYYERRFVRMPKTESQNQMALNQEKIDTDNHVIPANQQEMSELASQEQIVTEPSFMHGEKYTDFNNWNHEMYRMSFELPEDKLTTMEEKRIYQNIEGFESRIIRNMTRNMQRRSNDRLRLLNGMVKNAAETFEPKDKLQAIKEEIIYQNIEDIDNLIMRNTNQYEQKTSNDRFNLPNGTVKNTARNLGHEQKGPNETGYRHYENITGVIKTYCKMNIIQKRKSEHCREDQVCSDETQCIWQNKRLEGLCNEEDEDEDSTVITTEATVHQDDGNKRHIVDLNHNTNITLKPSKMETNRVSWDEITVLDQGKVGITDGKKVPDNDKKKMNGEIPLPRRVPRTIKKRLFDFIGIKEMKKK